MRERAGPPWKVIHSVQAGDAEIQAAACAASGASSRKANRTMLLNISSGVDAPSRNRCAASGIVDAAVAGGGHLRGFFRFTSLHAGGSELFGDEPHLKFVGAKNVADQQVVGPVIAGLGGPLGGLARLRDDLLVRLQQPEQLRVGIFAAARR